MIPMVSVVMASFNRASLLNWGLSSITQHKPPFSFEVVVVNDGQDDDGTKEVCEAYKEELNIKYVFSGHRNQDRLIPRNPAVPNNIAIQQSSGEIIVLTCPEMYHVNNALELVINNVLLSKTALSIPNCIMFDTHGIGVVQLRRGEKIHLPGLPERKDHVRMPFFLAIWKDQLMATGGYDEDFLGYAGEDNDLIQRLINRGCRYVKSNARVIHLYHGPRCSSKVQNSKEWIYNYTLWKTRQKILVRNVGRPWGVIDEKTKYWDLSKVEK